MDKVVILVYMVYLDTVESLVQVVIRESQALADRVDTRAYPVIEELVVTQVLKEYPVIAESLGSAATRAYLENLVAWVSQVTRASLDTQVLRVLPDTLGYLVPLVKVDSQEFRAIQDSQDSQVIQDFQAYLLTQACQVNPGTLVSQVYQDIVELQV